MYNLTEKPTISKSFLYQLTKPFSQVNESISFICIIEGVADISEPFRQYRMSAGDILFLVEEETYLLIPKEKALVLSVHFDHIFFRKSFAGDLPNLHCNSMEEKGKKYQKLLSALADLALAQISDTEKNRFLIQRQIYSLFHFLKAEFVTDTSAQANVSKQEQKLQQFVRFMQENCTEALTLQDAADYMDYTPQYLSSFIKKNLNCTFNTYLSESRLSEAVLCLKYRADSPGKIAVNCGFSNYNSFLKLFQRKYLVTPEEYRIDFLKRIHKDMAKPDYIKEPSIIREKLLNLVHFVADEPEVIETPIEESYTFDASKTLSYEKNWDKIINLGHALSFEKPRFRYHVAQVQEQFHFTHGRFGGILQLVDTFYDEDCPADKKKWAFNFSRAFQVIDFLLEYNLKPHIDFGGKPFDIYLTNPANVYKSHADYLEYLELTLENFLCACINRYGFDEVSTWNFEYWMHYNNFLTEIDSPEEFCKWFGFFYRTIKNLLPAAKVGGPGFNLFLPIEILKDALGALLKKNIIPDFISVLFYPYAMPEDHGHETEFHIKLTPNPDLLHEKLNITYKMLDQLNIEKPELYVTEYSTFVSPMNFINDSIYQGTFILKQTLDNLGHVPVLSYWLATDYSMQYPDSAELLFGGNGLLTKDGIRKPGYHAYNFLTRLDNQLIGKGEHYVITRSPKNEIQIILYNYTHFSKGYCENPKRYALMKNPDSAFQDTPPLQLDITLTNIAPGRYQISQYSLNREHGSILNEWIKLDYTRHIGPTETEHLKSISIPELMISKENVTDSIHISKKLGRNEMIMLTLHYML